MQVYVITRVFGDEFSGYCDYSIQGVYSNERTAKRIYDKWVNEAGLYETYSLEPCEVYEDV